MITVSNAIGWCELSEMAEKKRVKSIGLFDGKLLKQYVSNITDDDVEMCAVEHREGGYGICLRVKGSDDDAWWTLCPLKVIPDEES